MPQSAPPPQRPTPAQDETVMQSLKDSRRAGILLIVGVLLGMLAMPRNLLAVVALLPSLFYFVRTLRAQVGRAPAVAVIWTALGFVLASMVLAGTLLPYLFFDNSMALQECIDSANTLEAQSECTENWTDTFSRFTQGG
ncbi:hypothetical protein [Kytococcus sedentarius]|uniref:hypothetical protein n=1 Tax=Kytococcus sedentarius TaxID=1276 RepID=UPI0035BBC802